MVTIQSAAAERQQALLDDVRSVELPDGLRLPYLEQGDPSGMPVIFLHGITDSWRSFAPVLPALPASIHAFALTQRGHGDADRPETGYHPRDFAADVAAFLDSQDLDSAIVAGHSMGSTVALRFALDYPERTSGLVLMGAFFAYATNPVVTEFWKEVIRGLEDPIAHALAQEFQESTIAGPIPSWQLDAFVAESLKAPARVWRDAFAGLLEDEHVERIGEIAAPTMLVWGDQDVFAPESDQTLFSSTIADSHLEVYRGIGHALHWEAPERFAADLTAFVEGLAE